jgi:hypothetical protein
VPRWRAQVKQGKPVGAEIEEATQSEIDTSVGSRHQPVETVSKVGWYSQGPRPTEVETEVPMRSGEPPHVGPEVSAQTCRRTAGPAEVVDVSVWKRSSQPPQVEAEITAEILGNP